jgi:hypothetical protein
MDTAKVCGSIHKSLIRSAVVKAIPLANTALVLSDDIVAIPGKFKGAFGSGSVRFGRRVEDDGGLEELTGVLEWRKKTRRR